MQQLEDGRLYRFKKQTNLLIGERTGDRAGLFNFTKIGHIQPNDIVLLIRFSKKFLNAIQLIHQDQVGWVFGNSEHFEYLTEEGIVSNVT